MSDSHDLTFVVGQLKGSVDSVAAQMTRHMSDSKEAQERLHKEIAANAATAEKNFEILHSRINKVVDKQDEIVERQDDFRVDVEIIKGAKQRKKEDDRAVRDVAKWVLGVVSSVGAIFIAWFVFIKDHLR